MDGNGSSGSGGGQSNHFSQLSRDMKRMLDSGVGTNMVIVCKEGVNEVKFDVHKDILAARSEVFRAMFQPETIESHAGKVLIPDIRPKIFKALLGFIYAGDFYPKALSLNNICDLATAAHKYQISSLVDACMDVAANDISTDTAGQVVSHAHRLAASRPIRDRTTAYCVKHFDALRQHGSFKSYVKNVSVDFMEHLESLAKMRSDGLVKTEK